MSVNKNALLSTDKGAFFEGSLPALNDVGIANDDTKYTFTNNGNEEFYLDAILN